jgi:hypothetical protein
VEVIVQGEVEKKMKEKKIKIKGKKRRPLQMYERHV